VDGGVIGVLDLLMLRKNADGSLDAYELTDLDDSEVGELRAYGMRWRPFSARTT
jgi:hypothetical protein